MSIIEKIKKMFNIDCNCDCACSKDGEAKGEETSKEEKE